MSGSSHRGSQRRRSGERGAVLVEFSIVFVLFAFICYALVAFGMAMNLKSNLTHAAGEGARAAVGAGKNADGTPNPECDLTVQACTDAKRDAAIDRVREAMAGQSSDVKQQVDAQLAIPDNVKIDDCSAFADSGTTAPGSWCIRVAIPYDYAGHPIVPSAPGLGVFMPSTLTSSGVVQLSS